MKIKQLAVLSNGVLSAIELELLKDHSIKQGNFSIYIYSLASGGIAITVNSMDGSVLDIYCDARMPESLIDFQMFLIFILIEARDNLSTSEIMCLGEEIRSISQELANH